jgi:thymidine phosphorylase
MTPNARQERQRAAQEASQRAARERAEAGITDRVLWLHKAAEKHQAAADALRATLDPEKPERKARKMIREHEGQARALRASARTVQAEEANAHWATARQADTMARAVERGFEVGEIAVSVMVGSVGADGLVRLKRQGARPTAIWSGPEHAYSSGYLDGRIGALEASDLLHAAQLYRAAFEVAVGRTTSAGEGVGGAAKGPQLRIVEAADQLRIMRKGLTPRQLGVLDLICGHDMRARQAAEKLKAGFPATKEALRQGLATASSNWSLAATAGRRGQAVDRVREADAVLREITPRFVR